jgi:type I restriction enzyme S subunit
MVGSSGRQRVQQGVLDELELLAPPLDEQKKIGAFLASLDEKIALNNKINDNLQQQAQALYRSWFIDYTPFGGTVPADWCRGKLKDILQLQKRAIKAGAAPELPYLPIDTIPMKTFAVSDFRPNEEAQSSLIQFSKDDILIGAMRVYFHRVIIAPCDGITRTTCFVLKPTNHAYLSFGLLTCDLDSSIDHAQNTSKGSTMPYAVWDGGMGEIEIAIPPLEVAKEFNELVLPMLRQIQNSYFEVKALRELRDSLLPRLMSGNLDVSECF